MGKNQKNVFFMALLGIGITISGCVKAPDSHLVDGVKVAESGKKQEQASTDTGNEDVNISGIVLENMPERLQWKFINGDNQLHIDADVIFPEDAVTLYTGTVEIEDWEDKKSSRLASLLREAGYILEDAEIVVQKQENVWTSLSYFNENLVTEEKQGRLKDKNEAKSEECLNHLNNLLKEEGFFYGSKVCFL